MDKEKIYKADVPVTLTIITDGLTRKEATEAIELIIKHYRQTSYLANLSIDVNVNYKADYKVEEFEPFLR